MSEGTVLDASNDSQARSWVHSANESGCDFPIQNLPFAVFRRRNTGEAFRGGVAIGDQIVDLAAAAIAQPFRGKAATALVAAAGPTLNALMGLGECHWRALRQALFDALRASSALQAKLESCLIPQTDAEFSVPASIGDYTDFYTSIHHAMAVGRQFRPDAPLLPNYKWVPIGYHGRSSSVVMSGHAFHRPVGQWLPSGATQPQVGPTLRLDYELELGIFLGQGNSLGHRIDIAQAESHVFGLCLLNDWSARDIQAWEYQPLGPFLAKNFATTISPWIVPLQALAPFRAPFVRPDGDPQPLAYLASASNSAMGAFDIQLEAWLQTATMRARREQPHRLSATSFRHSYWTIAQLVTHHTINGCNLRPGDLLGTGTQSGPTAGEAGSLMELSHGGKCPHPVGSTEHRTFLEDGDSLILKGFCSKPGTPRIGFGEVRGLVLPVLDVPGGGS